MEEPQLPADINPNNFPAKLWRLVNSPRVQSICWDARGEGLIIDQPLFEREVLGTGPGSDGTSGAAGLFKTKSFASLTRQFNLYGFRKLGETSSAAGGGSDGGGGSPGPLHRFYSPHFLRDHPDLLVRMKRLTKANKAKLAAGLEVKSRPPTASQRLLGTAMDQDLLLPPSALGLLAVEQLHQPYHQAYCPTGLLAVEQLHQPYHQAYCPTATPRLCSPPAHTDPLTGCASPTASTYTHCSFLQENISVNCEPNTSETEGRQFASGTEPVNKSVEETDSSVTPRCRKRDLSSHEGKSSDLHVLADTAFEQEFFQKEETGE